MTEKEFGHYSPLRDTTPHAYNDPDLGPLEFLLAVMRDTTLPITVRIQAAAAVAPFVTPRPGARRYNCVGHHLEYIIGPNLPLHEVLRQDHGPRTTEQGSSTETPDGGNANSQSFSVSAPNNPQPHGDEPGDPKYGETTSHPPTFKPFLSTPGPSYIEKTFPPPNTGLGSSYEPAIDYSTPPTPAELEEIQAAVHALRPDLAHLPLPELHHCPCGHWISGTYPCCEALAAPQTAPHDPSKLN
jgi:hypothetical protein